MRHFTAGYDIDGLIETLEDILGVGEHFPIPIDRGDLTPLAKKAILYMIKVGAFAIKNNWESLGVIEGSFEEDTEIAKKGDTYVLTLNAEPILLEDFMDEFEKLSKTDINRYLGDDNIE
jgi:hypothetical protein